MSQSTSNKPGFMDKVKAAFGAGQNQETLSGQSNLNPSGSMGTGQGITSQPGFSQQSNLGQGSIPSGQEVSGISGASGASNILRPGEQGRSQGLVNPSDVVLSSVDMGGLSNTAGTGLMSGQGPSYQMASGQDFSNQSEFMQQGNLGQRNVQGTIPSGQELSGIGGTGGISNVGMTSGQGMGQGLSSQQGMGQGLSGQQGMGQGLSSQQGMGQGLSGQSQFSQQGNLGEGIVPTGEKFVVTKNVTFIPGETNVIPSSQMGTGQGITSQPGFSQQSNLGQGSIPSGQGISGTSGTSTMGSEFRSIGQELKSDVRNLRQEFSGQPGRSNVSGTSTSGTSGGVGQQRQNYSDITGAS